MFGLEFSLRGKGLNVLVRQFCEMFLIVDNAVRVHKGRKEIATLVSVPEDRCHDTRAAAAMQDCNDKQRVFIGGISDQEIANELEAQRTRGQIGTVKALAGKCGQCANAVGGIEVVDCPDTSEEALKAELYQQIGQLQVELDWLKKEGPGFRVRPEAENGFEKIPN